MAREIIVITWYKVARTTVRRQYPFRNGDPFRTRHHGFHVIEYQYATTAGFTLLQDFRVNSYTPRVAYIVVYSKTTVIIS